MQIYALGIGRNVDRNELRSIASKDSFVFRADDFNTLSSTVRVIKDDICEGVVDISSLDHFAEIIVL